MADTSFMGMTAEVERLRAALKPLAAIALWSDAYPDCKRDHVADYNLGRHFTVEQIKAARKAIADEPSETKEG